MEIEAIKRLIRGKLPTHSAFQSMCEKTEKYYHVESVEYYLSLKYPYTSLEVKRRCPAEFFRA